MKRSSTILPLDKKGAGASLVPFSVFSEKQVAEFKPLKEISMPVPDCTVDRVLALFDSPKWWERDDKKNKTRVWDVHREDGVLKYRRDVRVSLGPLKFRTVYAVSQFLTEKNRTVHMHCFEKDGSHLIARYRCEPDGSGVRVFNEELIASSALVVALGAKSIRTARINHLSWLKMRIFRHNEEKVMGLTGNDDGEEHHSSSHGDGGDGANDEDDNDELHVPEFSSFDEDGNSLDRLEAMLEQAEPDQGWH